MHGLKLKSLYDFRPRAKWKKMDIGKAQFFEQHKFSELNF